MLGIRGSSAAKDVDYFGEKKHGLDNLSLKELISIKNGALVLGPG